MTVKKICWAMAAALSARAASAQPPVNSTVNMVLVPVVVRDAQGRAVGSLRKEDFELFDNGRPQTIVKFSVDKNDSQPPAAHFAAWLFDDLHLSSDDLIRTRDAALRIVDESFDTGTRAAIYTTSGRTALDFTDDRAKLKETLNRIQSSLQSGSGHCPDIGYYQADEIDKRDDPLALRIAVAQYEVCNIASPDGQQVRQIVSKTVQRELAAGNRDTRANLAMLQALIRRISAMPGSRSVIFVSPGFHLVAEHRSGESAAIDAAIRANVKINAFDVRGPGGAAAAGTPGHPSSTWPAVEKALMQFDIERGNADADVLAELAAATGAVFIQNSSGPFEAFRSMATPPEYTCLLGFAPQAHKPDSAYRALNVKLKNDAKLELRARRGYFPSRSAEDSAEQSRQEIDAAVFSRDEMRAMPVELRTEFAETGEGMARISVVAHVKIKALPYRKVNGVNIDTLTVASAAFDREGNVVSGDRGTIDLKLNDSQLAATPDEGIEVKVNLDVSKGSYRVRFLVRDSEGQSMSARNSAVEIP